MDTYENRGDGWVLFAGVMIMVAGFLNFIYGIAAIDNSSAFVGGSHYVLFDNLNTWGWIILLIGIVQLFAAFSIWNRNPFGRVIGIASAVDQRDRDPAVRERVSVRGLRGLHPRPAGDLRPRRLRRAPRRPRERGPAHEQRRARTPTTPSPGSPPARRTCSKERSSSARRSWRATGLDARTFGLVKIAALIALDAPPASYAWQVANAIEGGASADDILGVLRAVAPQVGGPRAIAAAPEIMLALGLSLPDGAE